MRPAKKSQPIFQKNKNLTLDEFRPYLFFLMLCVLLISTAASDREHAREPVRFSSKPVYSTNFGDRKPRTIDQIMEAGDYLYVLPSRYDGFVQVYDLQGSYQHSLFFLEANNGAFMMACEDGLLYVQDQRGNVFVFRGNEFLEYVPRKLARDRFSLIKFEWESSTPGYVIRGTDLWRVSEDGEELVMADFVRFDASFAVGILTAFASIGILWLLAGWIKKKRMNR